MQEKQKKRFRLPHWLPFALSLTGVAVLMLLYIIFIGKWLGSSVPPEDKLSEFAEYALTVKNDIISLSELDAARYSADDKNTYFISKNGDEQALRNAVYEGAYAGETYFSELTGSRCARFYYTWYDLECLIVCDTGGGSHADGSKYTSDLGDGVTAAIRGYEKA